MKHDYRTRRWPAKLRGRICRMLAQWRQKRLAQQAFREISRRKSAHLLEDIGMDKADTANSQIDDAGRHRFWML